MSLCHLRAHLIIAAASAHSWMRLFMSFLPGQPSKHLPATLNAPDPVYSFFILISFQVHLT